jgi:membrane-bound lytic murein transglycosylase D
MKQQPAMIILFSAHTSGLCISARLRALLALFIMFFCSPLAGQAAELFPVYPSIRPNVAFWEDVYSRYTTRQGILHDQDKLAIVYTVVDLVDWNTSNSARINRELIKLARQHYKTILADLADGKTPATEN